VSPALSLTARPGDGGVATRKVAILAAEGVDGGAVAAVADMLTRAGVVVRLVGQRIGPLQAEDGSTWDADASLDNHPSGLFDGAVVPGGADAVGRLQADGRALEFLRDAFRHGKTLMALGAGATLFEAAGIAPDASDGGLLTGSGTPANSAAEFIQALAKHRHPERETAPPVV